MIKPRKKVWINPKIEIKKIENKGKGMFATKPMKIGETVLIWGGTWGEDYTNQEGLKNTKIKNELVIQWDVNLYSIEDRGADLGYFINHSCNANTWLKNAYTLIAKRNIQTNEEITVDYSLWEATPNYVSKWKCQCGSPICRKIITGNDWKMPKLQKQYKEHFSPLINKKIKKKNL